MYNASESSEDGINNTNTLDDGHGEGDSSDNPNNSPTAAITQPTPKRSRSALEDERPPKLAKVTGDHVLAESIVAVAEEIRASRKDRQEAIKARGGLGAVASLELSKTQAEAAKNFYESQVGTGSHIYGKSSE